MPKILAIDDKQDNLLVLKAIIGSMMPDCILFTALSGKEGIEKACQSSPDTILLDIEMPGMDGYETCRQLRANEQTKCIPIIMLTAVHTENKARGLECGADAFLTKPAEESELVAQIGAMLRIKAAEDQLRYQEKKKYDTIIKTALDGFWLCDRAGNFVDVNNAYCDLSGYSRKELLNMSISDVESKETQEQTKEHLNKLLSEGFDRFETTHRRKDGVSVDVEVSTCVLDQKAGYITSFLRDITAKKKDQAELKIYSEKLEKLVDDRTRQLKDTQKQLLQQERLAAIGKLSGSVAHDIRNPLGSVSNSVYFLNMIAGPNTDAEVLKHYRIMKIEIERASRIITDLMDFSRDNVPNLSDGDLNILLQEMTEDGKTSDAITVDLQLDSDLPVISFDPVQVKRIFNNLIVNSLQAMTNGGILQVCTRNGADFVSVEISDTGYGIAREDLDEIFEPLFTTKSRGVGLGLSIVKTFVEKHNGTINVESKIGKGTTFTVRLPIKHEEVS